MTAPEEEQRICVTCGFCCDGTLFLRACLNPGERGNLPEKMESQSFMDKGKEYFTQPCLYFSGKCTIYDSKKADVCSSYRCQLLKDFAVGKGSLAEALETVAEAMSMRAEIIGEYCRISGSGGGISFRQILIEMGNLQKAGLQKEALSTDYELLLIKCNIFEALLIKHFRSAEDFEKMIMK